MSRRNQRERAKCPNCHGKGTNRFGTCAYCKGSGQA